MTPAEAYALTPTEARALAKLREAIRGVHGDEVDLDDDVGVDLDVRLFDPDSDEAFADAVRQLRGMPSPLRELGTLSPRFHYAPLPESPPWTRRLGGLIWPLGTTVELSASSAPSPGNDAEPKARKPSEAPPPSPPETSGEDSGCASGVAAPTFHDTPALARPGMPPEQAARVRAAEAALEDVLGPARARYAAADPGSRALRPAELDWTTADERERLEEAQQALRAALDGWDSPEAARERVRARRAAREAAR